ncbi:hypothetical protein OYE22_25140 [Streptomyces sp. 71268]|nr:hypothetical protein [Streptomyces sp. 71268]WEV28097.1 hypothetical protein OYE22_25140 [Streptomyces sp. 71268]
MADNDGIPALRWHGRASIADPTVHQNLPGRPKTAVADLFNGHWQL